MGKKSNQARFPAARIKKLIQADEDVGKVAQATPIVVSKAIELFLGCLVKECVKQAEARGSKKITAFGLKQTVSEVAMFDFCSDIVAGVPDPIHEDKDEAKPKKKRQAKRPAKRDSDDEGDEDEKPKKRKRAPAAPQGKPAAKGKGKGKVVKDEDEGDEEEDDEPEEDEDDDE